jgi:flavin-dependent dehydrogenase
MTITDVIIVGAGPAGAMTAYSLAKTGVSVQLLEKAHFPRGKTCGGGLTHRAFKEIPFNIDPVIHQAVTWGYVGVHGRK